MNIPLIDKQVLEILGKQITLIGQWKDGPSVCCIPFMGSRKSFFYLVNLELYSVVTTEVQLVAHCLLVTKAIKKVIVATDLEAIEVCLYKIEANDDRKADQRFRVRLRARFSVHAKGFPLIDNLEVEDVLEKRYEDVNWSLVSHILRA